MQQFLYQRKPCRADMLESGPSAGRTLVSDNNAFGIVIFQAVDEQQSRAIMNADPAVSSQLMTAQLYPFKVAL